MRDEGIDPNAPTMEQTTFHQLLAELHLGGVSLEEFAEWKRTQWRPNRGTGSIEPVIAAAASVFGDAPLPDASMLAAQDNLTQQDMVLIQPDLIEAYFQVNADAIRNGPHRNDVELLWSRGAQDFRATEAFLELVVDLGLPAYWDLYGWPRQCRPTGYRDFVCEQ
jgi:hypothetical protein